MEHKSIGKYRERLDFASVKMAQFLVGGAEVMVNNGQSVISSLAVIRGNLFYMINWNPICMLWNQLE